MLVYVYKELQWFQNVIRKINLYFYNYYIWGKFCYCLDGYYLRLILQKWGYIIKFQNIVLNMIYLEIIFFFVVKMVIFY